MDLLAHQLPSLPPFRALWEELPRLYPWLERLAQVEGLPPIPDTEEDDDSWNLPSVLSVWGQRLPVEELRFAAANHLFVELGYQDRNYLIEPSDLRMTRSGQLTLYAVQSDTGEVPSYGVDQVQSIRVSTASFTPRFAVDASGPGLRLRQAT